MEQKGRAYPLDRDFGGIYTPDVTVFHDTERTGCRLMEDQFRTSIITVAAMNRPELTDDMRIANHLIEGVKNKIRTILRIGLKHGHDSLVLGAWGCGAFCNPPEHMAELFKELPMERRASGRRAQSNGNLFYDFFIFHSRFFSKKEFAGTGIFSNFAINCD